MVHVGKAHRPDNLGHAALASPRLDSPEQGVTHLLVVGKVDETESRLLTSRLLVEHTVDDTRDASYRLAVAIGHKRLSLAYLKRRIFLRQQRVDIVKHKRRHIARISLIEIYAELHIFFKFPFSSLDGTYGNRHYVQLIIVKIVD